MADVTLTNIRKSFGAVDVIKGVDLEINAGEFVVFVGHYSTPLPVGPTSAAHRSVAAKW